MSGKPPQHPAVVPLHEDSRNEELMGRVHDGDASALEEILALYWIPLVAYATKILSGRDAAEDVVQEAFIRLWEQRARWSPTESLRPFLYRITRNQALNESRRRGVRGRWLQSQAGRRHEEPPVPTQIAEANELELAVERAIEALPERRRELFILARFHDMSYRQIAQVMEISPQTVANQMSAALSELRGSLRPFLSETLPPPLKLFQAARRTDRDQPPGVAL